MLPSEEMREPEQCGSSYYYYYCEEMDADMDTTGEEGTTQGQPRMQTQPAKFLNDTHVQVGQVDSRQDYVDTDDDDDDEDNDGLRPLVIDTVDSGEPMSKPSSPIPPSEDSMDPLVLDTNNDSNSVASEPSVSQHSEASNLSSSELDSGGRNESLATFVFADRGPDGKVRQPTPSKTRRKSDKILPVAGEDGAEKFICPICKISLPNNHELTNHIRSHNTATLASANTCTICGKVLSSQSSLDRHMLVHSGERPFMCKICKMSFTTNGNMHRHMRIHEKELNAAPGSLMGDEYIKQPAKPRKRSSEVEGQVHREVEMALKRKLVSAPEEALPTKRKAVTEPRYDLMLTDLAIRQGHYSPMAVPKQILPDSTTGAYPCPRCEKKFSCRLSLESHLEQVHQERTAHCTKCNVTFLSTQGLHIHNLLAHGKGKPLSLAKKGSSLAELGILQRKQVMHLNASSFPAGFHDLSFIDFTSENFPLVAKAWCEKNPRRAASQYHNFTCRQCQQSFPCGSALQLHLETHPPECMAVCNICDCNFVDSQKFEDHMIQHSQDKILSSFAKAHGSDDNDLQDIVAKEDFLLVCGLKASEDQAKLEDLNKRKQEDMKMNNTYYARLGEVKPYSADNDVASDLSQARPQGQRPPTVQRPGHSLGNATIMQPISLVQRRAQGLQSACPSQVSQSEARTILSQMIDRPAVKQEPGSLNDGIENGKDVDSPDKMDRDSGPFRCDYCKEVFTNYRSYKGHVRAHLGLSPYKCNLCNYSSADKSTLIRHLRTHNGERPFQCLVCDFAFTTKANCERHVKKKHGHLQREEIDRVIGYNQFLRDPSAQDEDCFASPDTICKYCGEDFKFFRALKHHLRSHSSCRHKPFMCKLCNNGFSTKANCMRHIQKQHLEIESNQLEQNIHLNELYQDMDQAESADATALGKGDPRWPEFDGTPSKSTSRRGSVAHSPMHARVKTYITDPPVPVLIKGELDSQQDTQPLDFSMKGRSRPASPRALPQGQANTDEQPIDLTVRKPKAGTTLPAVPGNLITALPVTPHLRATSITARPSSLQTKHPNVSNALVMGSMKVPMLMPPLPLLLPQPDPGINLLHYEMQWHRFYNPMEGKLQCPFCKLSFEHGYKLLVHIRGHTKDPLHRCDYCPAVFTLRLDLENHLKVTHKVTVPIESLQALQGAPHRSQSLSQPPPLLRATLGPAAQEPTEPNNNDTKPCDSNCHRAAESDNELTSIPRMLDVANNAKLRPFLPTGEGISDTGSETPQPTEPRNVAVSWHRQGSSISPTADQETFAAGENISDNDSDNQSVTPTNCDGEPPSKRKRNSYSDSPHKLHCPYCPRAFPWISSLKRHLLTHTGHKPFKCPQCPVTFSTKSNRERHMIRKHGLNVHDPATRQMMDRPYKCHLCVFSSFASGSNLIRHYKSKHPDKEIPDSVMSIAAMGLGEDQCSLLDKLEMQDAMSEASEGQNSGLMELDQDELEDEADREMVVVDPEGKEVADVLDMEEDGLGKRLLERSTPCSTPETVASEKHVNPERDNYNVDKITDCWKCGAGHESRKALLRHLKEHNIDHPFKCYLCDASFEERRECLDHTVDKHAPDWEMLKEKNKVHDLDVFVKCMNEIVEQTLAGKLEGRTSEALTRMQLDELRPESDYAQRKVYCALCPKRFWSLQDLRRHMRSHTGERPFECDICTKRFTLKHSMMRHRRKHTDNANTSVLSLSDEEISSNVPEENGSSIVSAFRDLAHPDSSRSTPTWLADHVPFVPQGMSPARQSIPAVQQPSPARSSRLANGDGGPAEANSDILQNLLGIGGSDLDQMLTSTADDAAKMLGM